jgi:hypothetical protein
MITKMKKKKEKKRRNMKSFIKSGNKSYLHPYRIQIYDGTVFAENGCTAI